VVFVLDSEPVCKYATHIANSIGQQEESQVEFRTTRGAVFKLTVHLVFVTKYRRKVFTKKAIERLGEVFEKVCEDFNCDLVEYNGEPDHVHLLVDMVPRHSVSALVNSLKGVSSRRLRQEFPELKSKFFGRKVLWSPSYFAASTGGAPLERIKAYIQQQEGGLSSPA